MLAGLDMMKGMKLLALAVLAAKAELALGRKEATSVVVGFIDGPPLSLRKTALAAKVLRKSARLHRIATTKFSPLKPLKTYVTRRWQENMVVIPDSETLAKPATITHVIANVCPSETPKLGSNAIIVRKSLGSELRATSRLGSLGIDQTNY